MEMIRNCPKCGNNTVESLTNGEPYSEGVETGWVCTSDSCNYVERQLESYEDYTGYKRPGRKKK